MRILFIHKSFPAQFGALATLLAHDKCNQVFFLTSREEGTLPGVHKLLYKPHREVRPETHKYVRDFEDAVLNGQAAYRIALELKEQGFVPDIIYGHSGWGPTLYMKDIFPETPFIGYFEWFYHARGSDSEFGTDEKLTPDEECHIRTKNAKILLDLYSCDAGISPTFWQQQQFPVEFFSKIQVIHDGINTDYFSPQPGSKLILSQHGLDLSHVHEVVTYVTRGMEPYRGFPQLMEAVAILQKRRPNCHVVIVGSDKTEYGKKRTDGKTHKEYMLSTLSLDLQRIHFTGVLPYSLYRQVLRASSVHVYLTRPFVLSWSFLEAMSVGCMVVASATPPVQEVIEDGINGLLFDFFSPEEIVEKIELALDNPQKRADMCQRARQTVLERYSMEKLLPQQIEFLEHMVSAHQHK